MDEHHVVGYRDSIMGWHLRCELSDCGWRADPDPETPMDEITAMIGDHEAE